MVELEYQNERYMVENGQWYRRLKVGEIKPEGYEFNATLPPAGWQKGHNPGNGVGSNLIDSFRVPCPDPRPPFVVGQRVRVARKDDSWEWWFDRMDSFIGNSYEVSHIMEDGRVQLEVGEEEWLFLPWCLDAVPPVVTDVPVLTESDLQEIEKLRASGLGKQKVEVPAGSVVFDDDDDTLTPDEQAELDRLQKLLTPERLNALVEHSQAQFKTADPDTSDGTKPCMFCDRQLECACDDWSTKQPSAGGEVQFIFAYGSTKFDRGMGNTVFSAYVCDECAQSYVPKMRQETNITEPT